MVSVRLVSLLLTVRHCSLSCSVSRCGASFLLAVFHFWLFAPAVEFALCTMTLPEHHPIRLRTSTTFPPESNTGVDVDLQQSGWDTMDNRHVHSRGVLGGCCRLALARTCSAFCFRFASLLLSVLVLAFELDLGVLGYVRFLYIETRVPEPWIGTQQLVLRIQSLFPPLLEPLRSGRSHVPDLRSRSPFRISVPDPRSVHV